MRKRKVQDENFWFTNSLYHEQLGGPLLNCTIYSYHVGGGLVYDVKVNTDRGTVEYRVDHKLTDKVCIRHKDIIRHFKLEAKFKWLQCYLND